MADQRAAGRPSWWRWYEPPRWFPPWLHRITCTYCRGMAAYTRSLDRPVP